MPRLLAGAIVLGMLAASLPLAADASHRPNPLPSDFLDLSCDEREAGLGGRAMETSFRFGNCGGHHGMQTWYVGDRGVFTLAGGDYRFMYTETSYDGPPEQNVTIEASLDGILWATIATVPINASATPVWVPNNVPDHSVRPLPAFGEPFRFIRIHLDRALDGGLAGYLDGAYLGLNVTSADPATVPPLPYASGLVFDCAADILEDLFPEHPCWFGDDDGAPLGRVQGLPEPLADDGWLSSASYHHTYPVGSRVLTQVSGSASAAAFRIGDHPFCSALSPGLVLDVEDPTEPILDSAVGNAFVTIHVQTSVDGRDWLDAGTFESPYSIPFDDNALGLDDVLLPTEFSFALDHQPASFVRLIAQMSPTSALSGACERHEGYLLESELQLVE
jgi:hypothetical protein